MKISRILIVGTGSIGKRHLRVARKLFPKAQIAVLRRKSSKSLVSEEADLIFDDLVEALNFLPCIAIIANPAPFHIEIAILLANIGVHILIEKPISNSVDRVVELIELTLVKQIKLAVGYNLRFLPSLFEFKRYLEQDFIGKILTIEVNYGRNLSTWRENFDYRNSVSASKELGGGVLFELSHEIDYIRWIFGEVIWVEADLKKLSNLEIDVEDYASIRFGVSGKRKDALISLNLDCFRHDARRTCIVVGQRATIKWDAELNSVDIWSNSSVGWESLYKNRFERDYTYEQQLQDFVDCIIEDAAPKVSGYDGLKSLEIVLAAKLASQNQKNRIFL